MRNSSEKGRGVVFQDSNEAARSLCWTIDLLQNLQSFFVKETIPLDPSSPDWKIVKALLELLVRLGISPYLCPGVGILRDQELQASRRTLSHRFPDLSISNSLLQISAPAPHPGLPVLFVCAEVLASFIWHTPTPHETAVSLPPICLSTLLDKTHITDLEMADISMRDLDSPASPDGSKADKNTICSPTNSNDTYMPLFPPIAQLAMKFFLWDLMAAYLQISFGPMEVVEDVSACMQKAKVRLQHMVDYFPVEQMTVACFVLLNRESPAPPPWIKIELGKQLSKLVMRSGGLITIIEELVGRVTKGNVDSYDKVAGHLAKVPKSVATADEYFKAVCPQLLQLLLLNHKPKGLVLGETSLTATNNIFHTAVSLTCKLFSMEPSLAKKYLVQPLMRPLLALRSMQKKMKTAGAFSLKHTKEQDIELLITEDEVVDGFVQLGVLLTAGSPGSSAAREAILLEARGMAALSIKLHFQLAFREDPDASFVPSKNTSRCTLESKGITKGFLQGGLGFGGSSEQAQEHQSTLSKFKSSLADVVMTEVNQPVELALPCVLSFLLEHEMEVVRWPQEGEVWKALQFEAFQAGSKAMYLSKLLLMVENWALVLALMGELLHKILKLRQLVIRSNGSEIPEAGDLLRYMQDFEELNNEAGTKALEHDACGASSLLKALLDDELVLTDEDMLELVLHMVNSLLKGLHFSSRSDDAQISSGCSRVYGLVLTDLSSSIESVYRNPCVSEKLRSMSFTLAKEVSALCNAA